jgi:copper(I)-binding protein
VNRIETRPRARIRAVAGLASCALLAAAALPGCSSGQISQTANQVSAVNGTEGALGHVALRNVRIQADQTRDFLRPGKSVDLLFVATNQSPDTSDELTGISTDIGKVTVGGSKTLPAGGKLVVETTAGQDATPMSAVQQPNSEAAKAAAATVKLDKPISNGLTYDFTFDFKKAGNITLAVPIAAAEAPQDEPAKNE